MVTHRILKNTSDKPMKHPLTGQTIMPGQSYAEPVESGEQELKESAESDLTVQTIADPDATQKEIAVKKGNKSGDK